MKAMDRLGNELHPGDVVYFAPLQSLVVILDVEEPGKLTATPGTLQLGLKIPFTLDKGKIDAIFADVMRVHTPDEGKDVEKQVNDIIKGRPVRPLQLGKAG